MYVEWVHVGWPMLITDPGRISWHHARAARMRDRAHDKRKSEMHACVCLSVRLFVVPLSRRFCLIGKCVVVCAYVCVCMRRTALFNEAIQCSHLRRDFVRCVFRTCYGVYTYIFKRYVREQCPLY